MACQRHKARLTDAALEALDPAEATELKTHLEACAECRAEFERERLLLATIDRQLSTALEVSPSPEFVARVRTRLAAESARPMTALHRWAFAAAGALAACALLVGWFPRQPSPRHGPTTAKVASPRHPLAAAFPRIEPGRERAAARPPRPARSVRHSEPEVLIDPAEHQALTRFYNSIRAGRVDVSSVLAVPAGFQLGEDGSLVPKLLEIEPLKIAALQSEPQGGAEENRNPK